ncbi:mannosyl-3-phosphoglycerate phosphatase-related protein [Buttiauxella warmboldiae]|uniref:Mannosyl-3-phosphoglycerate phosphatase-related protein n=1 Tax=Buttiauxella warmboldiae TaxID=82993 RepID=A0A3N5D3B0_9ENTR|nr:mannosyl-3-phosphoglycerate phosphatase-related protein [Buttiauxella warmboldiae]RPH19738.1 mannosyl-3-phosphoglycerate phosphatase-related protein [Buttiauxella warmboldiae]
MPALQDPLLIISDLDGTLLEHHSYRWEAASPWISMLRQHEIPLVLCSAKSAAEIVDWQNEFSLTGLPFIAENGAVIALDARWSDSSDYPRLLTGIRHEALFSLLTKLRQKFGFKFTCFADVDENTLCELTGLTRKQASLAKLNEASETLIWRDSDAMLGAFNDQLATLGLTLLQGGRFWHVSDIQAGKDKALRWLVEQYRQREGKRRITIGLGDSPSDALLLDSVDYAVIVKGYSRQAITLQKDNPQRVYRSQHYGPEGWKEGLEHFITVK